MRRIVISLTMMLVLAISGPSFAQSVQDQGGANARTAILDGEGVIQRITERMIVVNDTALILPESLNPVTESGKVLSRSDLKVGDKVSYGAEDEILFFLGVFDNH